MLGLTALLGMFQSLKGLILTGMNTYKVNSFDTFQSLKGLILTVETSDFFIEVETFQSLKGLILTLYSPMADFQITFVSIP